MQLGSEVHGGVKRFFNAMKDDVSIETSFMIEGIKLFGSYAEFLLMIKEYYKREKSIIILRTLQDSLEHDTFPTTISMIHRIIEEIDAIEYTIDKWVILNNINNNK